MNLNTDDTATRISHWHPSTDIHDCEDRLIIKTDLAGVEKDDIDVSIIANTLFIKGEKKHEDKMQDTGFLRSERFFGQFERALPLSNDVDATKIDASYKNGVLTISIPKKEEAKPKQITIKVK
jgi:HSP20 family protein